MRLSTGLIPALAICTAAATSAMAADAYIFDKSHTQILFEYDHLGFSTTQGTFTDWDGALTIDADDPAASSLTVTIQADSLHTGWTDRDSHLKSEDFFEVTAHPTITFVSTAVEPVSENALSVTGDMTIHGITQSVTFDVIVANMAAHPMSGAMTVGFTATTNVSRTDFGVGNFAPAVGDDVAIRVSGEATREADL